MKEVSPCKGCTNRHTACHGSCDVYKGWLDRYHAQQKHLADNRYRMGIYMTAARAKAMQNYHYSYNFRRNRGGSDG